MQPSVLSPTNLAGRAASGPGGPAAAVLVAAQGRAQSHLISSGRKGRKEVEVGGVQEKIKIPL